jgi:hypothetical protein
MTTRNTKFLFWFVILALIMACAPAFATPFPTANPNQVNQFIALTANAAATRTAAAIPTSSPTFTATPTRLTETPSPTFTSTVIFILASPTPIASATLIVLGGGGSSSGGGGSGSGGTSSERYACQVISVTPANGTTFHSRDNFDAVWRVKNIGTRSWDHNSIDFIYLSGDKFYKVAGYDLSSNVSTGSTVNLGVDMIAPRNRGTYTTTWTLSVGTNQTFCDVSLTIVVR